MNRLELVRVWRAAEPLAGLAERVAAQAARIIRVLAADPLRIAPGSRCGTQT